jgi:predicted amidophosphoribosyltransferase
MSDHNECPTCLQDWVANTDYECGCCGRPASEHIRVTSLCRILRETQQRENALIVENKKLKDQLEQASEQYRLSSVCRELKAENETLKALLEEKELYIQRVITWPHDADPFCSMDHDNDTETYSCRN